MSGARHYRPFCVFYGRKVEKLIQPFKDVYVFYRRPYLFPIVFSIVLDKHRRKNDEVVFILEPPHEARSAAVCSVSK